VADAASSPTTMGAFTFTICSAVFSSAPSLHWAVFLASPASFSFFASNAVALALAAAASARKKSLFAARLNTR
jgi:hypothetical protein